MKRRELFKLAIGLPLAGLATKSLPTYEPMPSAWRVANSLPVGSAGYVLSWDESAGSVKWLTHDSGAVINRDTLWAQGDSQDSNDSNA